MSRSLLLAAAFVLVAATATPLGAPIQFTVPGVDDAMDLHGDPTGADLVIFAGGNQWFVMPELLAAFKKAHPEVRKIFYETLPPGLLAEQMRNGALQVGDLVLRLKPDVYLSGKQRMIAMQRAGLVGPSVTYATNVLGMMVREGNPKGIRSLADLGRADVRVAMPNPKTEGIARQIEIAYTKAGGAALDRQIMVTKVAAGTTLLTQIHHRQTPMWILSGKADAGPVWISEAQYQERMRSGIVAVALPSSENVTAAYLGSMVNAAQHRAAAKAFLAFLISPQGQAIYRSYGFNPPASSKE